MRQPESAPAGRPGVLAAAGRRLVGPALLLWALASPGSAEARRSVQLQARARLAAAAAAGSRTDAEADASTTPFFTFLLKEWAEVPRAEDFTPRCVALVSRLLPSLGREYTRRNVPKVLVNECDVYATKEDFVVGHADEKKARDARSDCRYAARSLGQEFLNEQNYGEWCADLHEHLEFASGRDTQRVDVAKLRHEKRELEENLSNLRSTYRNMKRQDAARRFNDWPYNATALTCCPAECSQCRFCS